MDLDCTVYRNRVQVGLGVELVTLGLVLGLETGFGRGLGIGLGIGLVSYKSIFIGKNSRFSFEFAHALDSRAFTIKTQARNNEQKQTYCQGK